MKINFKNNPKHRSLQRTPDKTLDFSKEPLPLFDEKIVDETNNPISIWAIPIMIDDETVLFGLFDGRLISYNFKNRKISSHIQFKKRIYSSPLVISKYDTIIVSSDSGELAALKTDGFELLWHMRLPDAIHSSPSFNEKEDLLYVGCYDNSVYAIDVHTGKIIFMQKLEIGVLEDPYSSPIIGDNKIFIGTGNKLISLTPDLKKIWEQDLGSFVDSSPGVCMDLKIGIVGTEAGKIILFSTDDGKIYEEWDTKANITCSPSISKNHIACIGNDKGEAYGINLKTKEIIWVKDFASPFRYTSITCTVDNQFIFTLSNGKILCLNDQSGNLNWQIFGTEGYHTPPLVTDSGYLLCGSHFGYIGGYKFSDE